MGMQLRNQVAQVALRFNRRWIGQSVERYPNNQQAQQTYRELDSHDSGSLCIYSPGTTVVYGQWLKAAKVPPLAMMQQNLSGIASDHEE